MTDAERERLKKQYSYHYGAMRKYKQSLTDARHAMPRDEQLIERLNLLCSFHAETLYTLSHYLWASDREDAIKKYTVEPDLLNETLDKMLSDDEEGIE